MNRSLLLLTLATALAATRAASQTLAPLPGSRITNAGVVRANATLDSLFHDRTRTIDTVDIGDMTAHLLARLHMPPFDDSLGFRVTADSARVRITGRLMDFDAPTRAELGVVFSLLDSTSVFVVEVSMPQGSDGIMRFRLERVVLHGIPIPDLFLLPSLAEYHRRYPVLSAGGRELLVEMPREARAALVTNGIQVVMPPKERRASGGGR